MKHVVVLLCGIVIIDLTMMIRWRTVNYGNIVEVWGPVVRLRFPWELRPAQKVNLCVLVLPSSIAWVDGEFMLLVAVMTTVPGLGRFI